MTSPVSSRVEGGVAVISVDSPPVNALSTPVRQGIATRLADCLANKAVNAIVLICAGRTFFAGADISEIGKPPELPTLHEVMREIENASKPVIAAIHGNALGGGLETALVCHYRIATASAHLGLPEVHLGLLPGGGGTQRLPRLIGVERALDLMVTGRTLTAHEGRSLGIIDRLAADNSLQQDAVAFARELLRSGAGLRRVRDLTHQIEAARAKPDLFPAFRQEHAAVMQGYKAPAHIVQAVEAAVTLPFEEGMTREWALFLDLEDSPESAAQRHIFFAEREASKFPGIGRDIKPAMVNNVVLVGSAAEDQGWLTLLRDARLDVVQFDNWEAASASGSAQLATCDLVLEASPQSPATPQQIAAIVALTRSDAMLAMATPDSVMGLAAHADRPSRVIGLSLTHEGSKLLEVWRGEGTAPETIATALALGRRLSKVCVISQADGGGVVNRLLESKAAAMARLRDEGLSDATIMEALEAFRIGGEARDAQAATSTLPSRSILTSMAEEGARMLADGTVHRASDIDVAAVLAAGWPAYRGGPMFWANQQSEQQDQNAKEPS